jgi:endo-1,4-beta-xylanase
MSDDLKVAHTDRRGFLRHAAASLTLAAAGVRTGGADAGAAVTSKPPYGAAVNSLALRTDPAYREAIIRYCEVIVPEGGLKWDPIHPRPDSYDFSEADMIAEFAKSNRIALRGHALVWYAALPKWVEESVITAQKADFELNTHIATVVGRYKNVISSWDVVNEPIAESPEPGNHLRHSVWLQYLGPEYIEIALRAAHESDPDAKLYINEFDIEYSGPRFDAKRGALLALCRSLKSKGVPLHGIGIQGHIDPNYTIDRPALERLLVEIRSMDMEVTVTELEVIDQFLPADTATRDETAAKLVSSFLETVCEAAQPVAVLTWGICDRYTWMRIYRKRADGLPNRPLPFDATMHPKKMFSAIQHYTMAKTAVTPR